MESVANTPSLTAGSRQPHLDRLAWWTLAFALVCGGILRLVWIEDMEWKRDEKWSFRASQEFGQTQPLPWVGMPTSLGFPNPGLSVWIFVAIGRVAPTPTSMVRAIALLNIIGLVGFAAAVRAYLPARQREPWIWGLALEAVSPFAIRMSRKIWPPATLTPLLLLLWISHRHRQTRWGAFAWGIVGALIGQVHLSGWFVAAGLVVGTVAAEFWRRLPRSRFWHWWLFGTILGLTIALPWARALPRSTLEAPAESIGFTIKLRVLGYLYGLLASTSSALPFQVLGLGYDQGKFEVGPVIAGVRTHAVDILELFVMLVFVVRMAVRTIESIVAPGVAWAWQRITHRVGRRGKGDAPSFSEPTHADTECASTAFYLWSTLVIPSAIFLVMAETYFYHYYFALYPFLFVLVAVCMLPWRRVLLGMVVSQALLSCAFLTYIHQTGGTTRGEYGLTYARQGNR